MAVMERRRFQWKNYLLAIVLTLFVFTSGLYVGNLLNDAKFESLSNLQSELRSEVTGTQLQYQLFQNRACSLADPNSLIDDIHRVGSRLSSMESQLGVDNAQVISLKEYYSLLEIQHFLFMKDIKKKCDFTYDLVLYFYSNAGDCSTCQNQGYVLSYVNRLYPDFNTYSFDVNIDNPAVRALKQYYNITTVPSIVADDKVYAGFQDKDVLMNILVKNESLLTNG